MKPFQTFEQFITGIVDRDEAYRIYQIQKLKIERKLKLEKICSEKEKK